MTDPNRLRVRFPCLEHGEWFRHMIKPVGPKPVWCDGGTTKILYKTRGLVEQGNAAPWCLIEIEDIYVEEI